MAGDWSMPSKWFNAKCPFLCGDPIEKGEPIKKGKQGWGHFKCDESIAAQRRTKFDDPHGVLTAGSQKQEVEEFPGEWNEPEELPF